MIESSPDARLRWLLKLAQDFPAESHINMTLSWENEHGSAGVTSYATEAYVFLNSAQQSIESLADAVHVLRGIFADEIVAVTAFAKDSVVYRGLAPRTDPSAGFTTLDAPGARNMPDIDFITIEAWSKGLLEK